MTFNELCDDAKKEVSDLMKEHFLREEEMRQDWEKTHGKPKGRDGGPTREFRVLTDEYDDRIKKTIQKYEAKEGK